MASLKAAASCRAIPPRATRPAPLGSRCQAPLSDWSIRMIRRGRPPKGSRSEEHTSELQSLMRISYAVFCLKKKNSKKTKYIINQIEKRLKYTSSILLHNDYINIVSSVLMYL